MVGAMRIGELLVEQRMLQPADLERVRANRRPGTRLVSALIETGVLAFDDGARALGQHKGIAAALAKHLNGRDPQVVKLLPAELGRAACALPIGRTSGGALIVCVRDPAPALLARLREALKTEILMVIAPAQRLEDLIELEYGAPPVDDFADPDHPDEAIVSRAAVDALMGTRPELRFRFIQERAEFVQELDI